MLKLYLNLFYPHSSEESLCVLTNQREAMLLLSGINIVIEINSSLNSRACEHIIKKDDLLIVARIINPTEVTDMLYWDKITETNNLRESLLKTSADLLQFYSELSPIKDISILVDVKIGDAKTGICDIAKDMDVDMVVLGSRGHGIVKRLLVGSVSSYLVHHLDRPIVVVKQT